eukprot:TRINITY_DN1232_c0_g1_i1.p1 TRINITY_DN1232_c0_g1~~TRINITY_DN1232_c0_g1_i1.p1  ORF type:complete len:213 (+),score=66.87 TRINITY_DN1232_c0_g1_i1:38-640(+)
MLTLLITFGVLVVLVFGWLFYMGVFDKLNVDEVEIKEFHFAYRIHVGPYKGLAPAFEKLFADLKQVFSEEEMKTVETFQFYPNSPKDTPQERLITIMGIKMPETEKSLVDIKLELEKVDLKHTVVPSCDYFITFFKYRNVFSYLLGPKKAYRALTEHIGNENAYCPAVEWMCDFKNIRYMFPKEEDKLKELVEESFKVLE